MKLRFCSFLPMQPASFTGSCSHRHFRTSLCKDIRTLSSKLISTGMWWWISSAKALLGKSFFVTKPEVQATAAQRLLPPLPASVVARVLLLPQ